MPLPRGLCRPGRLISGIVLLALLAPRLWAETKTDAPAAASAVTPSNETARRAAVVFDDAASRALIAMKQRADALHVTGVAVVAYAEGADVTSWSSRMLVVGRMTSPATEKAKGDNLLGIAYAKAAEMASTLKDSGSGVRAPYTGEFGWQGGVVSRGRTGWLIVAFSGGPSEDDVKISKAGLEVLARDL